MYVRPWVIANRIAGHLWWQRWGPQYEVSAGYVLMDGDDVDATDDWVDRPENVAAAVDDWEADRFVCVGREFQVSWVDADESRRIRDEVFQLGEPER